MTTLNTRADLDSIAGTDEYVQFMNKLKGSLFTVRKDNALGKWVSEESNELIEQYGFTRADFADITQPVLPEYKSDNSEALKIKAERNQALRGITHTMADGSVYQVRPDDLPNFNMAIQEGQSEDWVLADNSIRLTTVAEMQECIVSGLEQGKVIWRAYTSSLSAFNETT